MAWPGYLTYDSTEIFNVDRVEAYIRAQGLTWGFKNDFGSGTLGPIFQETYVSPMADNAPWTDPDRIDSYDFWGVYPLSVAGIEDSTRESVVTQYIRDGGSPGRVRHGTKSVVVSAALIGASEPAVEYGMGWLKAALLGARCTPGAASRCYGADLSYFYAEPVIADGTTVITMARDSFDRDDTPSDIGNPDLGARWEQHNGVWGILNDRAYVSTGVALEYSVATIDTGLQNATVEITFGVEGTGTNNDGLAIRVVDEDNFILVGETKMQTRIAGVNADLGSTFTQTFVTGDRMRAVTDRDLISIFRQAAATGPWVQVGIAETGFNEDVTENGLYIYGTTAANTRFENFSITTNVFPQPTPVMAILDGGPALRDLGSPTVDGGDASTFFIDEFDGGDADTTAGFLVPPYPEPFVGNPIPPTNDPTGCIADMMRSLRNVQVNDGPEITAKRTLSDNSVIWTVQWTAVAGDPFEYSQERVIVDGFLGGDTTQPFGKDVDGPYDEVGYAHTDASCPPPSWDPIYDPTCPALVVPPGPVDIPAGCFEPRTEWWRRFITIPKEFVPLWGQSVPIIGVTAQYDDLREVRVRIYSDPSGLADPESNECEPIGDLLVTYVPQGMTLVIDGVRQTVYIVDLDGVQRRADSLVFSSDGKPVIWPELTCGYGYLMTIDTTDEDVFPETGLSLVAKVA